MKENATEQELLNSRKSGKIAKERARPRAIQEWRRDSTEH